MRKLKELGVEDMSGPSNFDFGSDSYDMGTEHPVMPQPGEMEAMEML